MPVANTGISLPNLRFDVGTKPEFHVVHQCGAAIRRQIFAVDHHIHNVVIGPAMAYNPGFLDKLELPSDDRHIIVTVHYYEPMAFTHQGAPWAPEVKYTGRGWGTQADIAQLNETFDTVKAWSVAWRRPIWLGEFGACETAPMDSRIRYDSAVARAAEARGFAWCYWQFDKDFVVYDIAKDAWVEPILKALIPAVPAKN